MVWARMLAYITGTVDQELLLRNEYLAAENRILKPRSRADCFFQKLTRPRWWRLPELFVVMQHKSSLHSPNDRFVIAPSQHVSIRPYRISTFPNPRPVSSVVSVWRALLSAVLRMPSCNAAA